MEKDAKIPFKVSVKTNGMIRHNCVTRVKMTDIRTFEKRYSSQNNLYILVLHTPIFRISCIKGVARLIH